jgi:hypothetical protein
VPESKNTLLATDDGLDHFRLLRWVAAASSARIVRLRTLMLAGDIGVSLLVAALGDLAARDGAPKIDRMPDLRNWWRYGQESFVALRPIEVISPRSSRAGVMRSACGWAVAAESR